MQLQEGFGWAEQAIMQEMPSHKVAMQQVVPQHTTAPTLSHALLQQGSQAEPMCPSLMEFPACVVARPAVACRPCAAAALWQPL